MPGPGNDLTALDVLRARKALMGLVDRTPLTHSEGLSDVCGAEVHLKWENLQKTGSYKPRGALYRMSLLTPDEARRGVITASAGNWSLGVAMGAQSLGIKATICLPANTPKVKVDKCRALGAEIVLHGSYFDEAYAQRPLPGACQDQRQVLCLWNRRFQRNGRARHGWLRDTGGPA